jgi:hypothetical protein
MGRLEKPWQAVRLALLVTRRRNETLIAATDMGLVGEILFARMEDARTEIHAMRQPEFDPDALIDRLTEFTLLSGAIAKEVDVLRSGKWGKRLLANRTAIASVMEDYMEHAPREISAAIPLKRNAAGSATLVPAFDRKVDEERALRAFRYAKLISGCRYLASAASFAVKYKAAAAAALDMIGFYNEAVVTELYSGTWPDRRRVERQFGLALELTRLLLGSEEAGLLHRRGNIARTA